MSRRPKYRGADYYELSDDPSGGWKVGSWFWSDEEGRVVSVTEVMSRRDGIAVVRAS